MDTAIDVERLRKEYTLSGLYRRNLAADPFDQFNLWFEESIQTAGDREPNAMTLATASRNGFPSVRVVLLKGFDSRGVVFYTNYESRKGRQIAENPNGAINFFWPWLERQIQIEGTIEKTTPQESLDYFNKRPLGSRLGALASGRQSAPVENRQLLEGRLSELTARYAGTGPPLPDFWGGYRLIPNRFEFWQGRENRLHDRFLYLQGPEGSWTIERLAP